MKTNFNQIHLLLQAITCNPKFILTLFLILTFNFVNAQKQNVLDGKWHLEMKHNDLGLSQIIMEFESDEGGFEAYTRKGAVNDILGGWKSLLAKTFTENFKDGCLLRIEQGIYSVDKDTLKFAGILTSAIGNFNIEGSIVNDMLTASLRNKSQGYKGSISGSRQMPTLPLRDYHALFHETVALTRDKIYNKELLETKEWKTFESSMNKISPKLHDDIEMLFAFYYYAGKLPVSHYRLMRPLNEKSEPSSEAYKQRVSFEEKSSETAYMRITSFDGSAFEMDSIFDIVIKRDYKNLIVDMRNNPGGSVEAGMAFATRVADSVFYGGVFLTQKYFNKHNAPPTVTEYESFPHFTESNYNLLMDGIHNTEGLCLKIIPKQPVYKGKLYILTNGYTGSTCEPIVYGFKQNKRAVIVGSHTAGAMLAAEMFDLSDGFKIFLPTADYYASDGYRIDKKGVSPDIDTENTDALQYVLDNLIKS